jgi:hypothetical protein
LIPLAKLYRRADRLNANFGIYTGDFSKLIRLKFKNGNTIIYSNPFYGNINLEQFEYFKNPTKEQLIELYFSEETKQ